MADLPYPDSPGAECAGGTVIGCDVSSKQLDFTILDGDNVRFKRVDLGKGTLIERLVAAYAPGGMEDAWLVVEEPYGPSQRGLRALWATVGALTHHWGNPERTAWLSPQDWRAELGAKNTKEDGHQAVWDYLGECVSHLGMQPDRQKPNDEHQLDALGVALAWRSILSKQQKVA